MRYVAIVGVMVLVGISCHAAAYGAAAEKVEFPAAPVVPEAAKPTQQEVLAAQQATLAKRLQERQEEWKKETNPALKGHLWTACKEAEADLTAVNKAIELAPRPSVAEPVAEPVPAAGQGTKSPSERDFEKLYREYSARYHEKMVTEAEQMTPQQVTSEASRVWESVFGSHGDILKKRSEEILASLPNAPAIKEDQYNVVVAGERKEADDQPGGVVMKQFVWNPISAAGMALENTMRRLLSPNSYSARQVLVGNANLFWEAVDRNIDHPKLMQHQGPLVFIVEMTRKDDYFVVDMIRWLRPKAMGPMEVAKPRE